MAQKNITAINIRERRPLLCETQPDAAYEIAPGYFRLPDTMPALWVPRVPRVVVPAGEVSAFWYNPQNDELTVVCATGEVRVYQRRQNPCYLHDIYYEMVVDSTPSAYWEQYVRWKFGSIQVSSPLYSYPRSTAQEVLWGWIG